MTALVGRIPVKGVVTDPYPFKIVFSDDTLAANGLRVPNLRQMIVSGYTEGDLNLVSVRGWVTSLTFVFNDGTISTTTSNDNNIGRYTKENALGYLSDATGNPFIRGKLITNAPAYVGINVALGAAQGAANAFAQSQTTSNIDSTGNSHLCCHRLNRALLSPDNPPVMPWGKCNNGGMTAKNNRLMRCMCRP